MASNEDRGLFRRATAFVIQWVAAGLLAIMLLPLGLAVTLVVVFGETPTDLDESY